MERNFGDRLNNEVSPMQLHKEQATEMNNYSKDVYKMVSVCFTDLERAANLLSANGMFLKYAGPTIQNNYDLVKIAVRQNGDALQFASKELLMSDPAIVADLILSTMNGHPCEAFREVVNDLDYVFQVAKCIVEMDQDQVSWVSGHMYVKEGYAMQCQIASELFALVKRR